MASERDSGQAAHGAASSAGHDDDGASAAHAAPAAISFTATDVAVDLIGLLEPGNDIVVLAGEYGVLTDGERRLLIPILESALTDLRNAR